MFTKCALDYELLRMTIYFSAYRFAVRAYGADGNYTDTIWSDPLSTRKYYPLCYPLLYPSQCVW